MALQKGETMQKKQYVSMQLLSIIVAFTLAFGFMTTVQRFDSYADDTGCPTTTLNLIGANKDVTWQILKTMPFRDQFQEWIEWEEEDVFEDYKIGTPIERTWLNEDGVAPWWSIKTSELEKCGYISGISLSKTDGTVLCGFYASDLTNVINGTALSNSDLGSEPYNMGIITADGVFPDGSSCDA